MDIYKYVNARKFVLGMLDIGILDMVILVTKLN